MAGQEMVHVDEMLKFLAVFTGDDNYLKIKVNKEGKVSMCEVLASYKKAGIEEGLEKGREEGRENAIGDFVKSCLKKGQEKAVVIDLVVDIFGLDETKACEIVESNWE